MQVIDRRRGALKRLEEQLKKGVKNTKVIYEDGSKKDITVTLTEDDKNRIKSEIEKLKKLV